MKNQLCKFCKFLTNYSNFLGNSPKFFTCVVQRTTQLDINSKEEIPRITVVGKAKGGCTEILTCMAGSLLVARWFSDRFSCDMLKGSLMADTLEDVIFQRADIFPTSSTITVWSLLYMLQSIVQSTIGLWNYFNMRTDLNYPVDLRPISALHNCW